MTEEVKAKLRQLLHGPRVKGLRDWRKYYNLPRVQPLGNPVQYNLQGCNICIERNGRDVPLGYFDQAMDWGVAVRVFQHVVNTERGKRSNHRRHHLFSKIYAPEGTKSASTWSAVPSRPSSGTKLNGAARTRASTFSSTISRRRRKRQCAGGGSAGAEN